MSWALVALIGRYHWTEPGQLFPCFPVFVLSYVNQLFAVACYLMYRHQSHIMMLCLLTAFFKQHTGSELPGWVLCPHGISFSLCHHCCWVRWLHPHEPQDVLFPQHERQRRVLNCPQSTRVSAWRFCATSDPSASQASLEERWRPTHHWLVHVLALDELLFLLTHSLCGWRSWSFPSPRANSQPYSESHLHCSAYYAWR